ncbi:prephenate dehydrogenase [Pontibacillus yanchengensis]|uniref:Prephenate dehydrogenase n=1 Tax=Pontibacillus yanchengensis TaxID=462910 RepID=A0ACC7VJL5_9BACI|nr:prephenate dehydrogenase [Pontibacillus yanchengensis]MYL55146.1 prephenate dehydrogenase [Pontibacillus yanchengensis]
MQSTILVSGLGLIGGSIALNLKQQNHTTVIGFDQNKESLDYALKTGMIDYSVHSFEEGVHFSDVVVLATPVSVCIDYLHIIDEMKLSQPLLVTDVSSVKKPIMEAAAMLQNNFIHFVGGHPMAGSHKHGVEAAKAHLFENAFYLLVPGKGSNDEDVQKLESLLESTRSHFVTVGEQEHDQMTGVISHFPHLIASSLVHQAKNWHRVYPFMHELAAGGFRDITRIASSHPKMWNDILLQNKDTILTLLKDWITEMNHLKDLVETDDHSKLQTYLADAKQFRDGLPIKKKGAIPSFYDVYVDIHDQPGALSEVTHLLAQSKISIVNIQILEVREGITGVLRLSFQTEEDQKRSKLVLERNGYETTIQY